MSTPLIATLDASNCNPGNPCFYKPQQTFTAMVTLTVEEWNRIQARNAKLEEEVTRWRTTAEDYAKRINEDDFEAKWKEVIADPRLAKCWGTKGKAKLWLIPTFDQAHEPSFWVPASLRKVLGWPDHNCDLVTNFKCLYNSDRSSDMYKKFTALVTAKPPPASNQTQDAGSS